MADKPSAGAPVQPGVKGVMFLLPAYLIWGFCPIFWKLLAHVSSFELVMHRTWWSLAFLVIILLFQKRSREVIDIFRHPRYLMVLLITTLILAFNWYLFIWAVNHDQVLQTSLGYYINPLITVFLGMVFLKERLRVYQALALVLAGIGVVYYAVGLGTFPWIALAIAGSFAMYGLLHKVMAVKPLPGLLTETLLLSFPALGYIAWLMAHGEGALFNIGWQTDLLLAGTCLVTGLPLLFFTIGTKHSTLATVGFMQYIAPCCSFILAVFYYREPFSYQKLVTFIFIWTALTIYTADSFIHYRKNSLNR